jgi:hypothetical protein
MNYPFSTAKKEQAALLQDGNGTIYICIRKRGWLSWEPLDSLSAANWRDNRATITGNMEKMFKKEEKKQEDIIKSTNAIVSKTKDLFYKIYKNLSKEDKKLFLKENNTSWLAKESCSVCFNKATKKHKCIHNDCPGMCENCSKDMLDCDGKCKSCLKSQLIECPICYDENPVEKMCKSKTCNHYVCWSCYGKAYHCGRPIESCPSCRADFIEMPDYDSSDYDSDNDSLLNDDVWDDVDVDVIQAIEQNLMENDPDATSEDIVSAINMIINSQTEDGVSVSSVSINV